jgi:hypothetical protein
MNPFLYPATKITRIHGPSGYSDYDSYRPWLRDEFSFRCVYCLKRETWEYRNATFDLDHFYPQTLDPSQSLVYENLVYACHSCNLSKSAEVVPDPLIFLTSQSIFVAEDGYLTATTSKSNELLQILDLNAPDYVRYRKIKLNNLKNALRLNDRETIRLILGYPDDIPNLSVLRPPENSKPEGINSSHWAKRERGEMLEYY